jgi:hypothetical protein
MMALTGDEKDRGRLKPRAGSRQPPSSPSQVSYASLTTNPTIAKEVRPSIHRAPKASWAMRPITTASDSHRHASDSAASARNAELPRRWASESLHRARRSARLAQRLRGQIFSSRDKRQIKTPAEASSMRLSSPNAMRLTLRRGTRGDSHCGFQCHPSDSQPFQPKGVSDQLFTLVIRSYQVIVSLPSRIS